MSGQTGLFDLQDRYAELSKSGDPLERLLAVVDFEFSHPTLEPALGRKDLSRGGRPPLDTVLMFKILVLQALYGLSDEQAEYQVRDRLSFMRFLGLGLGDRTAGRRSMVHFRKPKGRPMPRSHQRANRARSAVRSAVEHVFADQNARMALFIRTIGLGHATVRIGIANLAYNFRRLIWLEGRTALV